MQKKIIFIFLILILFPIPSIATSNIISSELEQLNLSSFITEGEKYTQDTFENVNIHELLNNAITGKIDKTSIYTSILNLLGNAIISAVTLLGSILVIVIVHSILKSIGENIGNNTISQITYYVQYILIVTLMMSNFSEIIGMIKESIANLVGFINTLIPILLSMIIATREQRFSKFFRTFNFICCYIYRKYN